MPDLHPESTWSGTVAYGRPVFRATELAPIQEDGASRPSARAERRPAAALAAEVHELLESMARKRVPRLEAVRKRLHESRPALPLGQVGAALQAVHAATTALDFLAGRTSETKGEFMRQGDALAGALHRLGPLINDFLQREAVGSPLSRLDWIDLLMESGSLGKRVRQAARWLAEMDQDLLYRRKGANTDVALHAIDELARRGVGMHERLQAVHRLCTHARSVHKLSEQMATERRALWTTLQDRVLPACGALDEALQPLQHAASYRALVPTELIGAIEACHDLQVNLTQAAAQIARLDHGQQELGAQLALMDDKTRRVNG